MESLALISNGSIRFYVASTAETFDNFKVIYGPFCLVICITCYNRLIVHVTHIATQLVVSEQPIRHDAIADTVLRTFGVSEKITL